MNDETVKKAGTENARTVLESAEDTMLELLLVWDEFVRAGREGALPRDAEFAKASRNMVGLRRQLLEGIKAHERDVLNEEGRTDTAPIDFDARRDEIGRRLARLRDVRDGG